jgi:hypothetical protein
MRHKATLQIAGKSGGLDNEKVSYCNVRCRLLEMRLARPLSGLNHISKPPTHKYTATVTPGAKLSGIGNVCWRGGFRLLRWLAAFGTSNRNFSKTK